MLGVSTVPLLATAETDIVFSFSMEQFLWACGAIVAIAAAVGVIVKVVKFIKAPEDKQNDVIANIIKHNDEQDRRMDKIEDILSKDKTRLDNIEEGNRVVQRGILAMMNHEIDGNDVDKLTKARDILQEYLIEK